MSEFLFNYTDSLYPLNLEKINVEWSDLMGNVMWLHAVNKLQLGELLDALVMVHS